MILNSKGLNNYFNCSKHNHWVVNCPDLSQEHCDELAGVTNISISNEDLNTVGFLQNESRNPRVTATQRLSTHRNYTLTAPPDFTRYSPRNTWTTSDSPAPPSAPTAMPAPTTPPKKDGITTYLTYGLFETVLQVFSPSPS